MKGIAHFMGGLAVASSFPTAVDAASSGSPVLLILAGGLALLPDTLDFKFGRYLCRHDLEIAPDPLDPDAELVARALADAVCHARSHSRRICIKLHTVRLAADRWLEYRVRFRRKDRQIEVEFGRITDSGGNVVGRMAHAYRAAVPLPCDVTVDYGYEMVVAFLEGPTMTVSPRDARIEVTFLHWHRSWSHSLLLVVAVALCAGILMGALAGLICSLAVLQHILVDQLGFMGANLFFPIEKRRRVGLRVAASGDPVWNLAFVWICGALILWNLGLEGQTDTGLLHYAFWRVLAPLSAGALLLR